MFLWCGERDFLLNPNRRYEELLCKLGIEHHYYESEGDHSWRWWDMHIQPAMDYMLKNIK